MGLRDIHPMIARLPIQLRIVISTSAMTKLVLIFLPFKFYFTNLGG
jgi:hypothetical protein